MDDLAKLTLLSEGTLDQPYDYYAALRREAPVHFDEGLQSYVVTRYADVQEAARLTDVLSNELGFDKVVRSPWQDEIDELMWKEGYGPHIISNTLQVDPPKHARRSLGLFMILDHIAIAREAGLPHIYLGYWVPGSRKMDYKARFAPFEYFRSGEWIRVEDAEALDVDELIKPDPAPTLP